jgi:hypothetical protein
MTLDGADSDPITRSCKYMAREKKEKCLLSGAQLLARGDIIKIMDGGAPVSCKVLSCLGNPDGSCVAGLEILEGERQGQRIQTTLRSKDEQPQT